MQNIVSFIKAARVDGISPKKWIKLDEEYIKSFNKENNFKIIIKDKDLYKTHIEKAFRYIVSDQYLIRLDNKSRKYHDYAQEISNQGSKTIYEMNFKSVGWMTRTVVNANGIKADQYFSLLMENYREVIYENIDFIKKLFSKDDSIGKPNLNSHEIFDKTCSNNLQYLYESLHILDHLKKINIDDINIIEIGGGYGGLAFFLKNLSKHIYDINITSYSLFDIDEAHELLNKYSDFMDLELNVCNIKRNFNISENSFLISNYCFGEIEEEYQKLYNDKLFKFINHGYITWNFSPFNFNIIDNIKFENDIIIEGQNYRNNDIIVKF